jgi:two-component system, sensor histidine kinase PdtaS
MLDRKQAGLFLLLLQLNASAQIFAPIDRTYAFKKRAELVKRLASERPDSTRVLLLLDISNAYLKGNSPDSALFYSDQAVHLGQSLRMAEEEGQARFLACRADAMKADIAAAEALTANTNGIWKMRMLQELSEHYSFRPGNLPPDLDTAWHYIAQLVALTDTMHSLAATQNARAVLGKYYYERGDTKKGMDCFRQNILDWQQLGNKEQEAHWWSELAIYTPGCAETSDTILHAFEKARALFEQAGNKREALFSLSDLAEWHWLMGQTELAEKEQLQVDDQLPRLGQKRMYGQYLKRCIYELYLGNHNLALQLILLAKKNMDSLQEDFAAGRVDKYLAHVYWAENDIDRSLYWYRVALQEMQGRRDLSVYSLALRIVQGSILEGDLTGAEQFLKAFERENLPVRSRDKELIASAWGNIFEAMGEDARAEKSYLDMIRYNALAKEEGKKDIEQFRDFDMARPASQYTIGKFYVDRKQFPKARPYLLMALAPQSLRPEPPDILRDTHFLLFEVDSAAGDLASAIRHRLCYEKYADSISTAAKTRQLAELQIQYESANKDRDISLLSKQAQLQQADLSRSALLRNIILGSLLLALVIMGLLYNQNRLKKKNNETLQQLLGEKEILLREIHHRVKNNLQTIVSLLGSQSAYLNNEALQAIRDSQNRVYSISLIHQKLYQNENLALIEMSSYLPELVNYLRDIYDIRNYIAFKLDFVHLQIDISQAVSIGLILNEALTNAIKHAFPERDKGDTIVVEMTRGDRNIIHLKIADNGIGLPPDLDPRTLHSLGIKLMKGLTEDLGGYFSIESQNGTTIYIRFVANVPFENAIKVIRSTKNMSRV